MSTNVKLTVFASAALLAGCAAQTPVNEMAASAVTSPVAQPQSPPERHEAAAQCWMRYDKLGVDLDTKAKLVDKCIAERMKGKS